MSARPSPELALLSTALAGQYRVERELGRGGMGVVLLARDLRLDRLVAIKTLPNHLAEDAAIRERFLREARTAAALAHARIVLTHHADEAGGTVYFVMGFVGGSLAQHAHSTDRLTACRPRGRGRIPHINAEREPAVYFSIILSLLREVSRTPDAWAYATASCFVRRAK